MIAIINYGMGNLNSVKKALEFIGAKVLITADAEEIKKAEAIVLPGVGAFKEAMSNLEDLKIIPVLKREIEKGKPFLGICLGLQLLFTESEEDGLHKGLDIVKGRVRKFVVVKNNHLKIPHMGWNTIKIRDTNNEKSILKDIPSDSYFYFVHSYYVDSEDKNIITATTDYGVDFVSAIAKNNVYGIQFHPEKSSEFGLKILSNFNQLIKNG